MRTHSALRAVLRAVLLCSVPCLAVLLLCPAGAQAQSKPAQFTNGQNGTPNLPIAPSIIVDKNNMREAYVEDAGASARGHKTQISFLGNLALETRLAVADLVQRPLQDGRIRLDYAGLSGLIDAEYKRVNDAAGKKLFLDHAVYVGAEARAGKDKPVFSPELTYADTRSGLELGLAGYSQGAFADGASRRDGFGVSLKYIVGSLAARSLRQHDLVQGARDSIKPPGPTIQELYAIVNPPSRTIKDITVGINKIDGLLHPPPKAPGAPPEINIENVITALENSFAVVEAQNDGVLESFVAGTRRPALAFVVGDQSYRRGDIFSGGAVASYLHRFGEGAPGVTTVAVAQYLHDSFRESGHRGAGRLGLAVIYQNTTLETVPLPRTPTGKKPKR